MPNEFLIKNGLIVESGTTTVTGSVTATGGFTGSLFGTASVATSLAGGALTNFIEGFSSATQATSFLSASNAAATVNISIDPKGSGSILGAVPDGTAFGGNARGAYSVDLQLLRSAATQVASGNYTTILGGRNNTNNSSDSVLVAGRGNTIFNHRFNGTSVLVGGENNSIGTVSSTPDGYNFLGGGYFNTLTPLSYGVLVGGYANNVSGEACLMVGGQSNNLQGNTTYCLLGGGFNNTIIASVANQRSTVIVGGYQNNNTQQYGFIGGGQSNSVTSNQWGTIVGGLSNSVTSNYAFIGGGQSNTVSATHGTIAGGQTNTAGGQWATIGGGQSNTANGSNWPTVGGGFSNSAGANGNVVAGGYANNCGGNGYSAIVGGESNSLGSQFYGFIGAGQSNSNQASYGVICGGRNNTVSAGSSDGTIGGGQSNTIFNSQWTVIGGGQSNSSDPGAGQSNQHNVIAGGLNNISNSNLQSYTKIPGGAYTNASLYGQFAHASGRFAATGDAQAHELIWRRLITGTSPTELFLDGSSVRAVLPATNTIWRGVVDIAAVCTNAGGGTTVVGDVAAGSYEVTIKRLNTNTVLVGAVQIIGTLDTDTSMSTANFTIAADNTNEALAITFTPPSTADGTTTFRVVATFRGLQIQY